MGERMSINTTRACVSAILDGTLEDTTFEKDPMFGWELPESIPGVDPAVLHPRNTWPDSKAYDEAEMKLANMYVENFEKYAGAGTVDYSQYGLDPKKE